ncbi:AAC(3) family N-acetyltransferase [Amycolatopsis suaedae]|uniref:Aminoglycoside N(3)-acetyltransferase n=1 Tax=Amycolatopsis suaedae TaxID=2510978 RepID=A0A4Q7IZ44_9PSEU|nr:AAC(3) family N-acetyltransferase [Amycolatopsis suaedae]RZQ60301.1 AAC(3) family N-acetyltransferase [Amycolatopsis suaedae]
MQLVAQLRDLGVRTGDVLVVHTSFREVAPVDGGPAGLIEALLEALGDSGTLVMPSMTGGSDSEPYDPARTPTRDMGVVAETFWRMPGVLRGDHPTSTFAATGRHAAAIVAPQPLSPPHGLDSPIGRVFELGGSTLLLGVGHDANTAMHLAEDLAGVPYRSRDWALVTTDDGVRTVAVDEPNHCCQGFAVADQWLRGQRTGTVGNARARLFTLADLIDVAVPRLAADPLTLLCPRDGDCDDCAEAYASL